MGEEGRGEDTRVLCWEKGWLFFFQAEDGIRGLVRSRGLGDVYKRQHPGRAVQLHPARRRRRPLPGDHDPAGPDPRPHEPVSYTHLTLPTIYPV